MHQLFHTTCPDNRGFNRAPGFGVLAASCATEREIPPQIKEIAPYPFALIRTGVALPVRWVWTKTPTGASILVHCVYISAGQLGRMGTHFSHILFEIPPEKGLREILGACSFPFWKQAYEGPPQLTTVYNLPPGSIPDDGEVSRQIQLPEARSLYTVVLALALELLRGVEWKQIVVPAEADAVLNVMQWLVRVLPQKLTHELTFSSLEQRDGGTAKIIGVPTDFLEQVVPAAGVGNLLRPQEIWSQLPEDSREYANWCVERAIAEDWNAIQFVIGLAEQTEVSTPGELKRIWRFCTRPQVLEPDEVIQLIGNNQLSDLALANSQFLARALQVGLGDPLNSQLLTLLHQNEKKRTPSRKTTVETGLIVAAVEAAESGQLSRLQNVIEELRSFHRIPFVNQSFGLLSADFGQRIREILVRLNQRVLENAVPRAPTLKIRLELFQHDRNWLAEEIRQATVAPWLAVEDASECLDYLTFLGQSGLGQASQSVLALVLSGFFNNLTQSLMGETRLLEWLWNCPPHILAPVLTQVGASQAEKLAAIWKNPRFREEEFFAVPVVRPSRSAFESVYDVARVELLPSTIRQFIREGQRSNLSRVADLRDVDALHLAIAELNQELFHSAGGFDPQSASNILSVVCSYHPRYVSELGRTLEHRWRELSAAAAAWLIDRCCADRHQDERKIRGWIELLNDDSLAGLQQSENDFVRVHAAYACLQRHISVDLTRFDANAYCGLLDAIAGTISNRNATGREVDVSTLVDRAIDGLLKCTPDKSLVDDKVQERLIDLSGKHLEFVPLIELMLSRVSDEILLEQFKTPMRKSRWEAALRLLERSYDQYVTTIRSFVSKLIYVEFCNPWFRLSNAMALQHHLDYPKQDDTLSRRIVAARFLISENEAQGPSFLELLQCLAHEPSSFQEAFFRVLRQSGDATFNKLLKPFQDAELDRSISLLDRRFDELSQLWNDPADYSRMLIHFAKTFPQLFQDVRAVAASLFPLVRPVRETMVDGQRQIVGLLITTWSQQIPACSPDDLLWSLRECTADLDARSRAAFLELCGQGIESTKGPLTKNSSTTRRSWFGNRRGEQ